MPLRTGYSSVLYQPQDIAVTSNTFTGPQDLSIGTVAPLQAPLVLTANYCQTGTAFRMVAWGTFSTTGTPTLQFGVYLGTTALATSAAITTPSGAATFPWRMEADVICRTQGGATVGTFISSGFLLFGTSLTAMSVNPIPSTAMAVVNADTTAAQTLSPKATYSVSSASNIVVMHGYIALEYTPL